MGKPFWPKALVLSSSAHSIAMARREQAASTFCDVAGQLCQEMVAQLATEHTKETKRLFDEVVSLRGEMENVRELLQGYLGREKVLAEMMQSMQLGMEDTRKLMEGLHGQFAAHVDDALGHHLQQKKLMGDPIADAQDEVQRINVVLSHPAVPPPDVPQHLHQVVKKGGRMV